ncbi:hypothetical protein QQ045_021287 [Rhodiola kirilowii]
MSMYGLIIRSLRRTSSCNSTSVFTPSLNSGYAHFRLGSQSLTNLVPDRSFAFSSAEEAAAERRRRKRRLRIEPPLNALRRDPNAPRPRPDPNAPRLPDSTSALVGPRLNLHNRVQSLIRAGDLDAASAVARHSVFSSTRPTVFTCNAIMAAMYRAQRYDDAVALFQFFYNQSNIVPNVVSYNVLINTHCDAGRVDVGLEVYKHIIENAPFSPSSVTYRHLTKGLVDAGRIGEAVDLVREMLNKGHGADSLVYNNVIAGFLNLGNLEKANEFFDELKERCLVYDGVVNATFMDWFFKQGRDKEAMESYRSLLDKKFNMVPATCNVLIETLLKHVKKTEAWAMFENMLDNHKPPNIQAVNSDTFNIMVNECFRLGQFAEALETFKKVGTKAWSKPFSMDVAGYANIIARCCENGMISEAETLFYELCNKSLNPDVPTHRNLIDAYLKIGRIDDAVKMLERMADNGLRVIPSFSNKVLDIFVKHGKSTECHQILTKLAEKDPKPDVDSYKIVVESLCHENKLETARDLLDQMMRFRVGVPSPLREFVVDVFGKAGLSEDIHRVLDLNRLGYATQYSRPLPPKDTTPHFLRPGPRQMTPPQFSRTEPQQMSSPQFSGAGPQQMTPPQFSRTEPQQMSSPQFSGAGPQQMTSPLFSGAGPQQMTSPPGPQQMTSQFSETAQFPSPQQMTSPPGPQQMTFQFSETAQFPSQQPRQPFAPQQVSTPEFSGPDPQMTSPASQTAEPSYLDRYSVNSRS